MLKMIKKVNMNWETNVKEINMVASIEQIIDEIDVILKKSGLGVDEYRLDNKCDMYISIIPLVLRKPKRQRCRTFYIIWVQDVLSFDANKKICEFNRDLTNRPKDSRYVKGSPKNGDDEYVGIYFEDPVVLW